MQITGKIFRLPQDVFHDVNTDAILAGRYLRVPEEELGRHAFEGIIPEFPENISGRSVLVAGRNMGCGSSREQAPKALIGNGIKLVIAVSYGYIFYRNAINLGLAAVTLKNDKDIDLFSSDAEIGVDLEAGKIRTDSGKTIEIMPLPSRVTEILEAGGLLPSLAKRGSVL